MLRALPVGPVGWECKGPTATGRKDNGAMAAPTKQDMRKLRKGLRRRLGWSIESWPRKRHLVLEDDRRGVAACGARYSGFVTPGLFDSRNTGTAHVCKRCNAYWQKHYRERIT